MAIEIKVPDIGADEVEVTEIMVKPGDVVTEDQSLITVEGDKASMEVPSPQAGTIKEILIKEGDKVETGSLIMYFADESVDVNTTKSETTEVDTKSSSLIEIHVPDIGGDEVEVTEIMVSIGDSVDEEQSLITVEGDKASMEVPAPVAGVVSDIKVNVGDKVNTGSLIMFFSVNSNNVENTDTNNVSENTASPVEIDVNVPDIGGDEVEVTDVMVSVGDTVDEEQSLITVEGDKASMEVPAPVKGKVTNILIKEGDKVSTGSLIMKFEVEGSSSNPAEKSNASEAVKSETTAQKEKQTTSSSSNEFQENDAYVHASPVVRRLAREFGINLSKVKATGRKNRITKEDVQNYVKGAVQKLESGSGANGSELGLLPWPKVDFNKFGDTETKPLSRIKKISGANLHRNWVMIPHVTQWDNADITSLEAFRKEQNALQSKKKEGAVKITPLVFIMKAVAKALEEYPSFNSSLSDDGEHLIMKKYVNVGVAVDTPNGLVVPVFKDVNKKGIIELSAELMEISKKARAGKLTSSDMQGGCFTISSLGGIGGTAFTPIVNAPEVGILGVSKSEMKPVWNGKDFDARLMLPLSLSYDHRVIDGAEGARFITFLNKSLSDIRNLVM